LPRVRSPNRDKAKEIYLNSKGKVKLKDIATELGVLDTQIRKWKNQDKWDNELKGTLPKGKRNVTNKKEDSKSQNKEPDMQKVNEVLDNPELTDKQKLFCSYYVKYRNKTKAYQKAYQCSYENAHANAYKLWQNMAVKNEIDRLLKEFRDNIGLDKQDIIQKYIDIAFADITDYVEFGQEEVPIMTMFGPLKDKETGKIVTEKINVVKFKQSHDVDGTIISEVKQGKDGVGIKLQDKMKALAWLADHMDLLDTATREKLNIEQQKLEIAKIKAGNVEEPEVEDDGFIEALKGEVSEVWKDEDTE